MKGGFPGVLPLVHRGGRPSNDSMSKKIGRNDPCHCGSEKKYKHCCIDEDRRQRKESTMIEKKQRIADPFYDFIENRKKKIDFDPKRLKKNTSFSICKEKFEESIVQADLYKDQIFHSFLSLGKNARDYDEHCYVIDKVFWMKGEKPQVFKYLSGYFLKHSIASAIYTNRVDVLPELISWLDPVEHIGEFLRTVEMLFYFGDLDALKTLKRVFVEKRDEVKENSNILLWAKEMYSIRLRDLMIVIEYSKTPHLDSRRFYDQLKPYIPSHNQVGDVEELVVSPMNKGCEKAEEILTEIYRENTDPMDLLMSLKYSITGALTKTYNISVAKALLFADHLEDYFHIRIMEEERFVNLMIPEEDGLNRFFHKQLYLYFYYWKITSMMAILPYYTDLLQEAAIITPKRASGFKEYLTSLLPGFLSALVDYSLRDGVIYTVLAADLDRLYREIYGLK